MSRKRRISCDSGMYHIIIRSINQQQLFEEDEDYRKFLYVLSDVKKVYPFEIYGYCLMGNHIHMLIGTIDFPLMSIFRSFGSRFVRWYNSKYQRFGHLFQERYISVPIESGNGFLSVLQYIHENPVRANLCRFPSEYIWSSCKAYYGAKNTLIIKEPAIKIAGSLSSLQKYFHTHACEKINSIPQISHSISDNKANEIITNISRCSNPSEFQQLPRVKRNQYIRLFVSEGLTIAQVARLCGITRPTIYKIIRSFTPAPSPM